MRRSTLTLTAGAAAALTVGAVTVTLALAASGGSGTTDFGPYTQRNGADTGTCGNVWARGKQTETFRVFPQDPDGFYTVEAVVRSSIRSVAGPSLGACNNDGGTNGTIGAGVKVRGTSQIVFSVDGTLDPSGGCASYCDIDTFVRQTFGAGATSGASTDVEDYRSDCNGSWIASLPGNPADGRESGDIAGDPTTC